jgi:general stress protein 26
MDPEGGMTMDNAQLQATLKGLFREQLFAVLATRGGAAPHLNIVCFAPADELRTILFATPRQSLKFTNLQSQPEASLFVDNRSNRLEDLQEVYGVEIAGTAAAAAGPDRARYRELFLARFPALEEFVDSPGTALMAVRVSRYDMVHRFQEVISWEVPR